MSALCVNLLECCLEYLRLAIVLQERRGSLKMNWNNLFQVPNIDQQFKAWEINLGNKTHANTVRK